MTDLTPLGQLLERAREAHGISKREAARRAGISEGRWRQVTSGEQRSGGVVVPVNPRRGTVVNMARAVGVGENEALIAAGFEIIDLSADSSMAAEAKVIRPSSPVEALIREIYEDDRIPEDRKTDLVRRIRQSQAQAEAERQSVQDEINRWRRAG